MQSPKTPLQKSLGGLGTQLSFYSLIIIGMLQCIVELNKYSNSSDIRLVRYLKYLLKYLKYLLKYLKYLLKYLDIQ